MQQSRDAVAFSELVATRSAALVRTAYLVVGDHQLAQDLVQEALVKTYVAWPRLRDVSKAEAYARRTIVTTAISWRRRRSFHERPAQTIPEQAQPDRTDAIAAVDRPVRRWRSARPPEPATRSPPRLCLPEPLSLR